MGRLASGQELVKVMSSAQMRMLHAAMDSDQNDRVTPEEATAFVRNLRESLELQQAGKILKTMDANKDGQLSFDEFDTDLKHFKVDEDTKDRFRKAFHKFDDNGDGVLSQENALPLFNFMFPFQKLDTNKDGVLSFKEFTQIAAPKLKGLADSEVQNSMREAKQIFTGLDANSDTRLDAKEHFVYHSGIYAGTKALEKLFALADSNADDELTAKELVSCREHPQFGGSAAFNHAQDWIKRILESVDTIDPDLMAKALKKEDKLAKSLEKEKENRPRQPKRPKKPRKRKTVDKSEL